MIPRNLLLILVSVPFISHAQTPPSPTLSLEQAVNEAQSKSPAVRRARAAAKEADWKRVEAFSEFLPTVTASAYHFMGINYQLMDMPFGGSVLTVPQILPTTEMTLSASVPIFDGFQNVNHYASTRYASHAAELDAQWTEFQIGQDVTLKFMKALAAQEVAKVNDQNVKTLEDHLTKMHALRQGGAATNYDVLRVEVQLNEARTEQMQSQDNVILARTSLNELLDTEEDTRPLVGTIPEPMQGLTRDLKQDGIEGRLDLKATVERETAALKNDRASDSYWVPRVSLGGQYFYYNNRDNTVWDGGQYRDAYQYGIFLTWNLFDGMASIARSQQAAYQLEQAQRTTREKQLHAPYDFQFWKRRYEYSASLYIAKKSEMDQAEESVRLASEGLRAGTRTSTEMLDAELDLFRARAGLVNAEASAAEALANLESALGRKIGYAKQ